MHWCISISLALAFIFSFALGVFSILLNPRSRAYQLWFLTAMGVVIQMMQLKAYGNNQSTLEIELEALCETPWLLN